MYPYVVIFSMLISTSLIMSVAMTICWASLGRPRHAVTWSLAFALNSVQVMANAAAIATGRPPVLMAATIVLTMLPCALIAIGARQRAGLPDRFGWFVATGAATLGLTTALKLAFPAQQIHLGVPSFFTSAMLVVAVAATIPRARRTLPAEQAMIVVDAVFALVQCAIAVLAILHHSHPDDQSLKRLHESTLGIGLPAAFIASGIVRVLLIASDLAAELRQSARCDPLTGVLNRRGFEEAAREALADAAARRVPVTLAMIDLDHFKSINDRFGHARGDEVLQWLAHQSRRCLGASAVIGRLGGEEFGALLVAPVATTAIALDRFRQSVSDRSAGDCGVGVSISIGATEVGATAMGTGDALPRGLAAADGALYLAKARGRDRLVVDQDPDVTGPAPAPGAGLRAAMLNTPTHVPDLGSDLLTVYGTTRQGLAVTR